MTAPVLLWLRRDLRVTDQAALLAACAAGPVIPVYVLDDETPAHRRMGRASRWWLHQSLVALEADLEARGSRLILRRGKSADVLPSLVQETGAKAVHALHHYEPWWRNAERALGEALILHHGNYLLPPGSVTSGSGGPYRIYTPFSRATMAHMPPPLPAQPPASIPAPAAWPASDRIEDWALQPVKPDWAAGFCTEWQPGECGAAARLNAFSAKVSAYPVARNLPSKEGSARLSPHLHFGEISPAMVWNAVADARDSETFLKELIWRDYAQNIILTMPDYGKRDGRPGFEQLAWRTGEGAQADLRAWQQGLTGYPIVDAGMRQLWATGWMHNRVRMITASFLVKHLLIDWREGEAWFWDTLVDADYASNVVNWQWSAGTGVDANMFGRIMAPLLQSAKFDAAAYIRRWVPELAMLNDEAIHDPHEAGRRPRDYPAPLIGHREGRERALAALANAKGTGLS
jgi:deoxyribodipyrimidine photo-lyase